METDLRNRLMATAALFSEHTKVSLPTVGKRALNDNTFFSRMAEGQGFTVRTYDRVMAWLSAEWPAELAWPEGTERPVPAPASVEAA